LSDAANGTASGIPGGESGAPRADTWTVGPAAAGERLDRALAAHLDEPRNQVQRWIREERVRVGGAPAKASTVLNEGDAVSVRLPDRSRDERIAPEPGALPVLYEDADLVVIDKPAGLTVHPGAGRASGTLVHRLLARYPEIAGVGGPGRPGIVHRLDRETTGVLVVARTAAAYRSLSAAFAERRIAKRYLAVVHGSPPAAGTIEAPIGRHPQRRTEMVVMLGSRHKARAATTLYRTLGTAGGAALLEIDLRTGRTHQIRVHCKHAGYPLVGDPVYGEARWKSAPPAARARLRAFDRPALHAWSLAFAHPADGRPVQYLAPPPPDLRALWEGLGGSLPTAPLPTAPLPPAAQAPDG
jgi:23S rRNA pseudouridine1911/1915/1917 synthase